MPILSSMVTRTMKNMPIVVTLLAVMLTACVSPFRDVGTLEIQIKPEGAEGDRFVKEGEFELVTSVSCGTDILRDRQRIPGQESTFLIQETVSSGDLRGDHTDYLLLYPSRQRGSARPHPQVIPIDMASKKPGVAWSDWIVPKYSEQSEDSSWNLLYRTKERQLVALKEAPLAAVRYRLIAAAP